MRRVVIAGVWLLLVGVPASVRAQAQSIKIGYIKSQAILEQTPGYAAADSTLGKERKAIQDTLQRMQQQWDSTMKAFDQQSIALSSTAKQTKQRELQATQQRLQQKQSEMETRFQQRQQELFQPIQARIFGVVQGIRAEGNYSFIFDMDAPNNSILFADPSLDITAKVIERLRQPK
jgi:outer membrane protein